LVATRSIHPHESVTTQTTILATSHLRRAVTWAGRRDRNQGRPPEFARRPLKRSQGAVYDPAPTGVTERGHCADPTGNAKAGGDPRQDRKSQTYHDPRHNPRGHRPRFSVPPVAARHPPPTTQKESRTLYATSLAVLMIISIVTHAQGRWIQRDLTTGNPPIRCNSCPTVLIPHPSSLPKWSFKKKNLRRKS
jgi:hypothetical protein